MSTKDSAAEPGATEDSREREEAFTGQSVKRREDYDILTGRAEYIHDKEPPNCLHMVLVRSMHAHATVEAIDASEARAHSDCELVFTAADIKDQYNPMPCALPEFEEWPLADGKVRFAGEPVAVVVVSGDRYTAEDIADLVDVEYEQLDVTADPLSAREDPVVLHEDVGTNVGARKDLSFGNPDQAFADADHVVEKTFSWGRISGVPLETSGVVADYRPESDTFRIDSNVQLHTLVNAGICETLDYPEEKVDMRVPDDVGGSYGTKIGAVTRYCCLAAMASKELERPVRFVEDRIEYMQGGDAHSTEREYRAKLAVDDDGTMRGLDVWFVDDQGAYPRYAVNQAFKPLSMMSGTYRINHLRYAFEIVLTNKTSQSPYRGFGIQPQNFVLESLVDKAARVLGRDPVWLREQNLIRPDQMPYKLPTRNVYDSGDYPTALDQIREKIEAERDDGGLLDPQVVESRREEGKYRGVRPTVMVEPGVTQSDWRNHWEFDEEELHQRDLENVSDIPEHLRAKIESDGQITVYLATDSAGQGHQTIVTQLMADELGVLPSDIDVDYLGSADSPTNYGSAASRMAVMLSGAANGLADRLVRTCERAAAERWDCDEEAVAYREGHVYRTDGSARISLADLAAQASDRDDRLTAEFSYAHPTLDVSAFADALRRKRPSYATASFAANAPIVEVDVATGEIEILKFYSVRDCGTRLNPMIVEGQEHGGVAQGVGAALLEEFTYDDSGQPLAITMFDYLLPSIDRVPEMEFENTETPSPFTETGAKGVGESGITDAPASIACSVNDALAPLGVLVDQLPFTPNRVRDRIRNVREQ